MKKGLADPVKIFSYGSNMSSPRLAARVPSARFTRTGYVPGFALRFHKRGRLDGSGKANMLRTGDETDRVWGVVWEIDPAHKPALDRAEGLGAGYEETRVRVAPTVLDVNADAPDASYARDRPDAPNSPDATGAPGTRTARRPVRGTDPGWAYVASPDFIDD